MKRRVGRRFGAVAVVAAVGVALAVAGAGTGSAAAPLHVVATKLNNPRKLSLTASGTLAVAEAGSGGKSCATGNGSTTCTGTTSSITLVGRSGQRRVVVGLPSAASPDGSDAEGAADVLVRDGRYLVLLGNGRATKHAPSTKVITGDLVSTAAGTVEAKVLADFGAFEAAHDPDRGAGPGAAAGDPALDSNPYAFAAYRGGYAIVDSAGNDLLWLDPQGKISVLAVFPTQREHVAAGVVGKKSTTLDVQSVPSSVAVGPDGALYVGELTGYPFEVGKARVWRVDPGHAPAVYASGFTNISDLSFEGKDLLVLEIAAKGLRDAASPGALIRLEPGGSRTVVAGAGLVAPTGIAVGKSAVYISNYGTSPASGSKHPGEIVSIAR